MIVVSGSPRRAQDEQRERVTKPWRGPWKLPNLLNRHPKAFCVKLQRSLPGRTRVRAREEVLDPRVRVHEINVADFPQNRGQQNVGDGEFRAGDPLAAIKTALQPA